MNASRGIAMIKQLPKANGCGVMLSSDLDSFFRERIEKQLLSARSAKDTCNVEYSQYTRVSCGEECGRLQLFDDEMIALIAASFPVLEAC